MSETLKKLLILAILKFRELQQPESDYSLSAAHKSIRICSQVK